MFTVKHVKINISGAEIATKSSQWDVMLVVRKAGAKNALFYLLLRFTGKLQLSSKHSLFGKKRRISKLNLTKVEKTLNKKFIIKRKNFAVH